MFESADLDHHVSKAAYKREAPKLRAALLDAQYDVMQDGRFNEWMDPRHVRTRAFGECAMAW